MRTHIISGLGAIFTMTSAACLPGDANNIGTVVAEIRAVCPSTDTLEGLDVSYAQGPIDWTLVRGSGRAFAYARATGGLSTDDRFAENWPAMRAAGMVRGAYHFFHPTLDPDQQADLFIRTVGHIAPTDLPPMLDVETYTRRAADGTLERIPAEEIAAAALRWIHRVQAATGRIPVVYTATFIWSSHIHSSAFAENPLWIADWHEDCPRVPAPWTTWVIHQYAPGADADHTIPGINRHIVDHDRFNGGRVALDAFIRSTIVPAAVPADAGSRDGSAYDGAVADDARASHGDGGVSDGSTDNDAGTNSPMPSDPDAGAGRTGCSVGDVSRGSSRSAAGWLVAVLAAGSLFTHARRRRSRTQRDSRSP